MKSVNQFVILFILLINLSCGERGTAKEEPPKPQIAAIKFQSDRIDAGIVNGKTNVIADFKFINTGTIPLVINEVRGNCHCVQGTKPERPVAPGDSSVITVSFDPVGISGTYQRTMTVYSNATQPEIRLFVTGDIQRDPKEKTKRSH